MTALTEAFVPVRPDMDRFEPEVKKKLRKIDASREGKQVATRFGVGFNGAFGGIASKSAGLFAAGFAAIQGVKIFGGFIQDARESEKVSRITANAIRATGGAAKISADQVSALATSISNKTAIDDEQIQTAANMLLTFKNIRNETGKGNDVFNQATQAAADLSVQFGGMDGASKQLGKALNDPIKGTTALAKAGVTFTQQQKDQIKTLVESGDTLSAQKIILKEIQGQVGGAAAAAADPMERLKVIAGNLGEEFGGILLPTVNRFSTFLSDKGAPALRGLIAQFEAFTQSKGFQNFLTEVRARAVQAFEYFQTNVMPRLREFAGFVGSEVVPRLREFAGYIRDTVAPIVAQLVRDGLTRLQAILGTVKQAIADNRPELTQLANGIRSVAKFVIEQLIPFLTKVSATTLPVLQSAIKTTVDRVGWIVRAFNAIKEPIRAALAFVWEKVSGFFSNILSGSAKAFGWVPGLGDKLKTAAEEFRTFKDGVNRALDGINDEPVNVKVGMEYASIIRKQTGGSGGHAPERFARGGGVFGAGTATSDSIPALLSNGEHVWTAKEVSAAGGHGVMEQLRKSVRGFAAGGGVDLKAILPGGGRIGALAGAISRTVDQVGTAVARSIAKGLVAGRVNPGLAGALGFAKSQAGKPYIWGGVGPGGYDCSGFMSAITNVILGRSPYRRLFATGGFPTSMFARGMGAFSIGSFRGNPGHMAGTLNGVNVESRGGQGVVIGRSARGAKDPLFRGNTWHLKGYAAGGAVGDSAFDLLDPRGKGYNKKALLRALGIGVYDGGGRWPSGTLGANLSGKTETVRTPEQEASLTQPLNVRVFIGDRELTDLIRVEIDANEEFNGTAGRMGGAR